jgi:hypothetical protein
MTTNPKGRRERSEKFVVRRNLKLVKRKSARRMSLRKSQKSKLLIPMNIHPANVVVKREKKRKRSLYKLQLQLHRLSRTCRLLRKFAALSI